MIYRAILILAVCVMLGAGILSQTMTADAKSYAGTESSVWPTGGAKKIDDKQAYWIRYVDIDGNLVVRLMNNAVYKQKNIDGAPHNCYIYDECDIAVAPTVDIVKNFDTLWQDNYNKITGRQYDYENPYDKIKLIEKHRIVDGYDTVSKKSDLFWDKIFNIVKNTVGAKK